MWGAVTAGFAIAIAAAAPARAQGADTTCVLPLTKTDPATVNAAFPDEAAIYWVGGYQQIPGMRLRITGRYPHSRYFSFNVYDLALRPIDALADVEIEPDAGSANPFLPGADRTAPNRRYTAFVDFGPVPATRARNTLYTGTGQTPLPNTTGSFILRVYLPDKGRDETGGLGLPTVTLEPTGNRSPASESPCTGLAKPPVAGVNEAVVALGPPPPPGFLSSPGTNPPQWIKFRNLVQTAVRLGTSNPLLDDFAGPAGKLEPLGGQGSFLSNVHNAYVSTLVNRGYGEVSLTEVRAPTFPDTRPGPARMPAAQLRYFSLCTNDLPTQRFIGCRTDDQTAVGTDGRAAYVVSVPAARPEWATIDCGYTWLPFGPSTTSLLILRHMLPAADFAQAIQRAEPGTEMQTMGGYFPVTRYVPGAETPACRAAPVSSGPSLGLPSPKRCVSRRRFTIRLSRRLRSATVYVAGRRVRTLRGERLRARVNLKGLPRGTFRVRIVGRTKGGRRVTSVRTYRTCRAKPGAPG